MFVTQVPAFRAFWYPVAFADDLAEGPIARTVLGEQLVIWSSGPDSVSAAPDRCPHRSSKLSIGWVTDGCIVCPYHGWQFGGDGRARHIPQLDPGLPIPPKAALRTVHATLRYGVVWIALDEPVGGLPEIPEWDDPGYRAVRQFDEVWAAAAPRLVDNSFDPAHVAYVHRETFGTPDNAVIDAPMITFTDEGLESRTELVVENHLEVARRATQVDEIRTVRTVASRFVAPFLRVMSTRYPNGLHHILVTGICPVDDEHLRLVQWAIRNDTEAEVPAADVVAFDRAVTLEDKWLLEQTVPDYELELTDLVHLKVDRGTIAVRKIYRQIVDGSWPALAGTPHGRVDAEPDGDAAADTTGARPDAIPDAEDPASTGMADVPVVDISGFASGSPEERAAVARAVLDAFERIGFVLISGHGVPEERIAAFYDASREFFELPLEEKLRVKSPTDQLFQGYACPGEGPGYHTSARQSFNVGRFDSPAEAIAAGYPDDIGEHLHEALWPERPARFRDVWRAYFDEMDALAVRLLRIVEAGLGLEEGRLDHQIGLEPTTLVANYYSDDIPVDRSASPFRFGAHRDGDIFTILHQDDGPGSLQLHQRGAGWRDVAPVPGTFVVNIGELLERLTNDRLVATPHRVLAPPADQRDRPRMSAPYFLKSNLDAVIAPLPELLGPDEAPKYGPITGREWLTGQVRDIFAGYDSVQQFNDRAAADPSLR